MKKKVLVLVMLMMISFIMSGCSISVFDSEVNDLTVNDLTGEITGNTYECKFYSNTGDLFMTVSGEKIGMNSNIVEEPTYNSSDGWGHTEAMSAVVTITIDGNQIENCGSTVLFAENGLVPDKEYTSIDKIESSSSGLGDSTMVANVVNKYKKM